MRVLLDTNGLIYLLDRRAPQHIQDRLKGLLQEVEKARGQVVIPTLVVSEYLVNAGQAGKALLASLLSSRYVLVAPFDHLAAEECAVMQAAANTTGNKRHPLGRDVAWQKVKVDRQIVAIAQTRSASIVADESDVLASEAWRLFGHTPLGAPRVQAVCDFVHNHIVFDYALARPTRTAAEAYNERSGVCRDFAHLAVAFCRALNVPTRYCTGYISDIGTPKPWSSMDFAAWMEVWLGDRWWTFDPRNNQRRKGRTVIGRGRDASDVAMVTTFGAPRLESMTVRADEDPYE